MVLPVVIEDMKAIYPERGLGKELWSPPQCIAVQIACIVINHRSWPCTPALYQGPCHMSEA